MKKVIFVVLGIFALAAAYPVLFLLAGSLMGKQELAGYLSPVLAKGDGYAAFRLFPMYPTLRAYVELLLDSPGYFVMFWNSIRITAGILLGQLLVGVPAVWAFARYDFPLKKPVFTVYITLMMMPFQVTMLSNYLVLDRLSLMDTLWAVILPGAFSTFPVFIMYRFFTGIPEAVVESARIDGAGEGRALEDAGAAEGTDSTEKINNLDLDAKKKSLEKLEKLKEDQGQILSPVKGVVTELKVSAGDNTPDTAIMTLADLSSGCRFVMQIDKSLEKYIARKDPVRLSPADGQKDIENLEVESITPDGEDKTKLNVTVLLPADTLEIGAAAKMTSMRKEKVQDTCIPVEALHMENSKYYVLVAEEKETVLGTELTAARKDVVVKDKNSTYAALEGSSLLPDDRIITGSDRNIGAGSRIRLRET